MKRALVLSGGGSKGAYSVGVIKALLEAGRQYDVVAGVSVGALIGANIAMFSPEEQASGYANLERVWTEEVKSNKSIYKNWAPWILTYLWSFWKGGIYSMRPLRDILVKEVDFDALKNSGVEFEVGVVSLQTGQYRSVNVTSNKQNHKLAVDWIWASCVFPVLFTSVEINGEQWVDGGVRNVIPLKDVLKYPDIKEIDIVLTTPRDGFIPQKSDLYKSALDVGLRSAELLSDEIYKNDLEMICQNHGIKLNIYDPSGMINNDSFKFDPDEIKNLIKQGYQETKVKINKEANE